MQNDDEFKEAVLKMLEENKAAIEDLTNKTKGLVEAWEASRGAIKMLSVLGKIIKWVATVVAPIAAAIYWFKGGGHV